MKNEDNFIMLPTVDFCFKELMQDDKVRQGFIAALLDVKPEEVAETTLLPTVLEGEFPEEKQSILDVRVSLCDGSQMDMEMQVAYFSCWKNRTIYYLGKMYVEQLEKGDRYRKLRPCYHVSILDYVLYPDDDRCYRTVSFRDNETNEPYSDQMEIKILELPKLPKEKSERGSVYDWMRFFRGKTKEELKKMAAEYEYFDVAYNKLVRLSADDVKRMQYERHERNIRDIQAIEDGGYERGEAHGREEGWEEGREEGMQQMLLQLIERKIAKGQSAAQIAEALEETPERIEELIRQMKAE